MTLRERLLGHGAWYYTLTVATAGLFAWVPFVHAGTRLRDSNLHRRAVVYGGVAVVLMAIAALTPEDAVGEPTGRVGELLSGVMAALAFAVIVSAVLLLRGPRAAVYGHRPGREPEPLVPVGTDPAVANALEARQKRADARALLARDPLLARDLRIGRPDLAGGYDDGGLVDLNSASAEVIVSVCAVSLKVADAIVSARALWASGFTSVAEVIAYVDLSERDADVLRDRAVLLPL